MNPTQQPQRSEFPKTLWLVEPAPFGTTIPSIVSEKSQAVLRSKPNPLMMRTVLNAIDAHSKDSVMIGGSMYINVIIGLEIGLESILVLSGVTRREDVQRYSYTLPVF